MVNTEVSSLCCVSVSFILPVLGEFQPEPVIRHGGDCMLARSFIHGTIVYSRCSRTRCARLSALAKNDEVESHGRTCSKMAGTSPFAMPSKPKRAWFCARLDQKVRMCHATGFPSGRKRSGLRRGVARNRMRTEAGKMSKGLIFSIGSGFGESKDRFGFIAAI